jgi:hypothetical protein
MLAVSLILPTPSALMQRSGFRPQKLPSLKADTLVEWYAQLSEAHTRSIVERMNRAVFGEP